MTKYCKLGNFCTKIPTQDLWQINCLGLLLLPKCILVLIARRQMHNFELHKYIWILCKYFCSFYINLISSTSLATPIITISPTIFLGQQMSVLAHFFHSWLQIYASQEKLSQQLNMCFAVCGPMVPQSVLIKFTLCFIVIRKF